MQLASYSAVLYMFRYGKAHCSLQAHNMGSSVHGHGPHAQYREQKRDNTYVCSMALSCQALSQEMQLTTVLLLYVYGQHTEV